jgi:hypothetical protein
MEDQKDSNKLVKLLMKKRVINTQYISTHQQKYFPKENTLLVVEIV